jgi:hypothetical protein
MNDGNPQQEEPWRQIESASKNWNASYPPGR